MSNKTNPEIIVIWRLNVFQVPLQSEDEEKTVNEEIRTVAFVLSFIHSFKAQEHYPWTYIHTMPGIYSGSSPWPRNVAKESI